MFGLLFDQPWLFVVWIVAILVALGAHEFSHALVGTWLGDPTAERSGRLTLNPAAHVDPLGFLALLVVGFGWGKPVPYNPLYLRDRRWGPVLIALAGPLMNLFLATVFALVARVALPSLGTTNLLIQWLLISIQMNLGLMLFNLIPVPPLDGSKFLLATLSERSVEPVRFFLETRGPVILLFLVIADRLLPVSFFGWLGTAVRFGTDLLLGV